MSDKKIIDFVTFQRMKAHLSKKAVLPSPKAQQAVADFCIDSGLVEAVADAFGYLNGIPMEDFSEAPAKVQDRICIAKDELRRGSTLHSSVRRGLSLLTTRDTWCTATSTRG